MPLEEYKQVLLQWANNKEQTKSNLYILTQWIFYFISSSDEMNKTANQK